MAGIHLYDVLKRPIITEKSSHVARTERHYTFEVDMNATKVQIKEAVELIFDVRVDKVNTMIVPAKRGRRGYRRYIRKSPWKKAVVKLEEGYAIGLFEA
jgi:large subunit ribosomal protein L23